MGLKLRNLASTRNISTAFLLLYSEGRNRGQLRELGFSAKFLHILRDPLLTQPAVDAIENILRLLIVPQQPISPANGISPLLDEKDIRRYLIL